MYVSQDAVLDLYEFGARAGNWSIVVDTKEVLLGGSWVYVQPATVERVGGGKEGKEKYVRFFYVCLFVCAVFFFFSVKCFWGVEGLVLKGWV